MHNSKTAWIKAIIFLIVFFLINNVMVFVICPKGNYSKKTIEEMYYKSENNENIDVVFAGSSYFIKGINPYIMDKELECNTFDYSFSYQTYIGTYYCLKEFFEYHSPKLVVLNTDLKSYTGKENPMAYIEVAPYIKSNMVNAEYLIDSVKEDSILARLFWWRENHVTSIKDALDNVKQKRTDDYKNYPTEKQLKIYENNTDKYGYIGKGFVRVDTNDAKNVLDNNKLGKKSVETTKLSDIRKENLKYFEKIVDLCKENNAELVLIQTPLPTYRIFSEKNYFDFSDEINRLAKEKNIDYYDFNLIKPNMFKLNDAYFEDYAHFNGKGADLFSKSFADFLKIRESGEDMSKYFYNRDEYFKSIDYINNTWFTNKKDKDNIYLKAESFYGSQVRPEYQFVLIDKKSNKKTIIRDYDTNPEFTLKKPDLDQYKIRVNAREVGSNSEYSKYYEEEFKK